jgi:hypothetical protein
VDQLGYEVDFTILEHSEARDPGRLKDIADQIKKTNNILVKIAKTMETATKLKVPPELTGDAGVAPSSPPQPACPSGTPRPPG